MGLVEFVSWAESAFSSVSVWLNNIVIAMVILLVGFILGRISDRFLHRLFLHINFDDYCFKIFGRRRRYAHATRRFVVRAIYVLAVVFALARLNLDKVAITSVLFILVMIFLISLILVGVDILPNILARWRLGKRNLEVGDKIEITDPSGTVVGKIEDITFLEVQIKRANGDLIFIPMAAFLKNKIKKKR